MRLIDADALKAKIMIDVPGFMECGSSITKAFIMAMLGSRTATPTIDAVPVVRCKDCKYLIAHYGFMDDGYCESMREKHCLKFKPNADWFCADGERKEGR